MDQYDLTSQSPQYLEKMFFGDVLCCYVTFIVTLEKTRLVHVVEHVESRK